MIVETRPLTVSLLTRRIADSLEGFGPLVVRGELTQVKVAPSGHLYAILKDSEAAISLVMWRSSLARQLRLPKDGEQVEVRGTLSVFPQRGQYQVTATRITPIGEGDLLARLAALKERLTAEGLFAEERKRPLPLLPRAVGLATASASAALADLLHSLRSRFPAMTVVHAPCVVQGTQAPAEIVAALRRLSAHPLVDVIICGRGGGSLDDLMAFNDEAVVRAIVACPVPVVSAVGHETDWTLADLAADVRAKTPTAAGELVVPVAAELRSALAEQRSRLDRGIDRQVMAARHQLAALSAHRALASPGHQIALRRQHLDDLAQRLDGRIDAALRFRRERLVLAAGRLAALSPLAVLGRGYAVIESAGQILRRIADAPTGTAINARLSDGWIDAQVTAQRPLP